jgi:hypothetical protein
MGHNLGPQSAAGEAVALFHEHGGTLRTSEVLRLGISPRTLYALRDAGVLEPLARGLFRLADLPPLSNPDLVIVAHRIPQGVVCLVSALAFYELTTQIPHAVDLALESGSTRPRLAFCQFSATSMPLVFGNSVPPVFGNSVPVFFGKDVPLVFGQSVPPVKVT